MDIRDELAAALAAKGIVRDVFPAPVDMGADRARELAWGAYGMTPPVDKSEEVDEA